MIPIIQGVFLGCDFHAQTRFFLEKFKINTVINCAKEIPNYFEQEDCFDYINFSLTPAFTIGAELISRLQEIASQERGNVFIHCNSGSNRSVVVLCLYVFFRFKMSMESILALVKNKMNDQILISEKNLHIMKELDDSGSEIGNKKFNTSKVIIDT